MENKNVRFIRVRGRIVPIRMDKQKIRRENFGAAAVVAGAAVAAGSTRASNNMRRAAGKLETFQSKAEISMYRMNTRKMFGGKQPGLFALKRRLDKTEKVFDMGYKAAGKANKLRKLAPFVKNIGIWTGASLIGSGLARMFESRNEGNLKGTAKELGFTAATGLAFYGSGDAALRAKAGRGLAKIFSRGKM